MRAPESGAETEGDHLGLPAGDAAVATQACKQAAPPVEGATLGPQAAQQSPAAGAQNYHLGSSRNVRPCLVAFAIV